MQLKLCVLAFCALLANVAISSDSAQDEVVTEALTHHEALLVALRNNEQAIAPRASVHPVCGKRRPDMCSEPDGFNFVRRLRFAD